MRPLRGQSRKRGRNHGSRALEESLDVGVSRRAEAVVDGLGTTWIVAGGEAVLQFAESEALAGRLAARAFCRGQQRWETHMR